MRRQKRFFVYILMNQGGTTLYIGVTNDLIRRTEEHRDASGEGFTQAYRITRLVYFEEFNDVREALLREKQLKGWKRTRKEELIRSVNPHLLDLSGEAARRMADLSRHADFKLHR